MGSEQRQRNNSNLAVTAADESEKTMTEQIDYTDSSPEFSSTDIELFSTIYALTKQQPSVSQDLSTGYGVFACEYTDQVQTIITAYASGSLMINARDLLVSRRRLFRAVRDLGSRP